MGGLPLNKILVGYFVAPKISRYNFATSIGDIFQFEYGKSGRLIEGVFAALCAIAVTAYQVLAICFITIGFTLLSLYSLTNRGEE